MSQQFYRSRTNRVLGGICGGVAEYFGIDPLLVRILTILIALLPGPAFLVYLIIWALVPVRPE